MASSYQGYARATGFQQLTATAAGLQKQREQDEIKIRALEKQKEALEYLLYFLKLLQPEAKIHGHRDFANKACPSFDATKEYENL